MKSEFGDRETLGTQLLETHEEHLRSSPIEANELSHEGGKSYIKQLVDTIEEHLFVERDYFIEVHLDKPREYKDRAFRFRFFVRRTEPDMQPNVDCWGVNNDKCSLALLWSLPDWRDMPKFLDTPHEHDKQLIGWIKQYEKIQASRRKRIN